MRADSPTSRSSKRITFRPRIDPTLAARYHRLITEAGKHHNSALCTVAAVLLTRIAACQRTGQPCQLRDTDGTAITEQQGREIIADRYTIPATMRAARRQVTSTRVPRRNERATKGVAKRSEAPPVPEPACTRAGSPSTLDSD